MSDYDTDILTWSERQAALLRRVGVGEKVNDQVDWENVIEEIEGGKRGAARFGDVEFPLGFEPLS